MAKNKIYDRLNHACPHPILQIFGKIRITEAIKYKAISPQQAAFYVFSELLKNNEELHDDLHVAFESSGLTRSVLTLGKILEGKIQHEKAVSEEVNEPKRSP